MTIKIAERIGRDLPDEAGAASESGNACRRVSGRSAADLMRGAHMRIEPFGFLFINQPHRTFDEPLADEEIVACIGNHVDNGVANAQNIEAGVAHSKSSSCSARLGA